MSGSTSKLIRKVFSDRRQYQWFKHVYNRSTSAQKKKTHEFMKKLVSEGKKIEYKSII